jgi:hypothetical protein
MKIVSYEEMVELPIGSIFCKYVPTYIDTRWTIKTGETVTNKYNGQRIFSGVMNLEPQAVNWKDMPHGTGTYLTEMSTVDTRSFDIGEKGDLFAVLEDYEIVDMAKALIWALNECDVDFRKIFKQN